MDLDSDDVLDPDTALEYARLHGLSKDYRSEDLQIHGLSKPSDDEIDRDIRDLSAANVAGDISGLLRERLAVNKDAALLLKEMLSFQAAPTEEPMTIDRRRWMLSLKQELPLLSTDPEFDALRFGNPAMLEPVNSKIPLEVTLEENDESLQWPSKYFQYPARCDEQIKAEKLAITKEVLIYLQDTIRDEVVPQDYSIESAMDYRYKENPSIRPITPPLLPLSPPLTPYIPSSPANRIPIPTDSSDSVMKEAQCLEHLIMDADSLQPIGSDNGESMLLDITQPMQSSPLLGYHSSPRGRDTAENLKVEGPLTPPMFSTSPMKKLKSVTFSEILTEYIPTMILTDSSDDKDGSSIDFDDYDDLLREIEPLATEAKIRIENEQLSGADTTARVEIPELNFSLPISPWDMYSQGRPSRRGSNKTELESQSRFLLRIKREDLRSATSWHGVSALERELKWNIFTTRVSSLKLEEQIHGEMELEKILAELKTSDITTSSSLVWKQDGLRLFDQDEEEEEVELEVEEMEDMEAVLRKRKIAMEEETGDQNRKRIAVQLDLCTQGRTEKKPREITYCRDRSPGVHKTSNQAQFRSQRRNKSTESPNKTGNELLFGGFSASTALHKFMETRGKLVRSISTAHHPEVPTLPIPSREASHEAPVYAAAETSRPLTHEKDTESHLIALPEHLPPCSFIASSILLQRRSLLKQIEHLYPSAEIIYRDYTLPHCASNEADMILSPSTGLIFTTLQQVKQRALPGQPDRSPLKERMLVLNSRYERLIILISEGLTRAMEERDSPRPTDPRDQEALSQFDAFATQLKGEIRIEFVRGGEQGFARGVVVQMAKYGLPHGSADIGDIKPFAVETSWECFLRRAGLNPFAAQVILASLKNPIEVPIPGSASADQGSGRVCGLPAFLMMRNEERVRYLQAIMGGGRVLRSVSRVLDQEWVSAAHGFRMG